MNGSLYFMHILYFVKQDLLQAFCYVMLMLGLNISIDFKSTLF